MDGLERAAAVAKVRIVSGAHVASIARESQGFVVTTAGGDGLRARSVIVATGPGTSRKLLSAPALGAELTPIHAACLDVGLAALPKPDRLFALGMDRPTYFSVHSASARLAHAGATIHVMKYLSPDEAHHARDDEGELEAVLDRMQPGWREQLTPRRFLPNLVATNALVAAGQRRPEVDATGIAGAFVAGDWVGEGSMLADAALASSKQAAERAISYVTSLATQAGAAEATIAAP